MDERRRPQLRWYFRTFGDQSIRMVDLNEAVKAAKGDIVTIEMETTKQPVANVSANVTRMKQAAN
jgi:choloylglycine hydrolase